MHCRVATLAGLLLASLVPVGSPLGAHCGARSLTVILYPFVPAKDAYFRTIETAFERQHPEIDLHLVDLSGNYYNEDSPDAVTNTFADIVELDSVFFDDFVAAGRVQELPAALRRPAGTYLAAAEQVVSVGGKTYGLPHWVCSNFLFSDKRDPVTSADLDALAADIGTAHATDRGLLIDLKGRSTLGEWYLDALLDRHRTLAAAGRYLDPAATDSSVLTDLTRVRGLCDADLCREDAYHDATGFYPAQLARRRGRALAGYSERLYHLGTEELTNCRKGECLGLEHVAISALPLSSKGSQPFAWVDSFVIARSCTGDCLSAAEAFLSFMADSRQVRATLTPGWGEAPRYLLPALKALYSVDDDLHDVAPLYVDLLPLVETAVPVHGPGLNRRLRAIGKQLDGHLDKSP